MQRTVPPTGGSTTLLQQQAPVSHTRSVLHRHAHASRSSTASRTLSITRRQSRARSSIMAAARPPVMVNSCTGKMGQAVAEAVVRAGLTLVPYTLCVAKQGRESTMTVAGTTMNMVEPHERDEVIASLVKQYPGMITVDYTFPATIHEMVDLYVHHRTPFVMGTTGGDRAKLLQTVRDAGLYSVIAPNMAKQIVAFQQMMNSMATSSPGVFSGYTLRVVESHQSSKKDTSGTAKAVVESFQQMGIQFDVGQIELVRTPEEQMNMMKVPESALLGHAFHTYQLCSPDGKVTFEFQHNVCGPVPYAEGTVDAVLFLAEQIAAGSEQKNYNMIDVLGKGSMR